MSIGGDVIRIGNGGTDRGGEEIGEWRVRPLCRVLELDGVE